MSTITCLSDRIGIEPCEGESPYMHHISELEGLSLTSIAATADPAKYTSARTAIEGLVPLGAADVLFLLKGRLSARGVQYKKVLDTGEFCAFGTQAQSGLIPGDGGVYVQKNCVLQPDAQPIRVKWIEIKSPNLTTNIPVRILSDAGVELWSTVVTTLAANTALQIQVDQDFYENKLKIVIEGTAMQGYYAGCGTLSTCRNCIPYSNPNNMLQSAFYVNAIEGGVVSGFKAPGMRVAIELPCPDGLFCKYSEDLAPAVLYASGIRILKDWKAGTRLNVFTLKKEWVAETLIEWDVIMKEKVEAVVDYIAEDIRVCFPRCFPCVQPVGFLPTIP